MLKLSYDGLNDVEKDNFLDVAFFLVGDDSGTNLSANIFKKIIKTIQELHLSANIFTKIVNMILLKFYAPLN